MLKETFDLMTGPRQFIVPRGPPSCDDRSTGFFVPKGSPSSRDDRSTGIFCSARSALITWWQVHRKFFVAKVHPHHVMTGPPAFFVPKGPPSSCDDRSTGFFYSKRSTLITWLLVHRNFFVPEGSPSSRDDRSTGYFSFRKVCPHHTMTAPREFFGSERYTLITQWQVHRNFLFPKVRPHYMMRGPPEIFVPKGSPSWHDDRSMLSLCQTISQHLPVHFQDSQLLICGMNCLWRWRDACIPKSILWRSLSNNLSVRFSSSAACFVRNKALVVMAWCLCSQMECLNLPFSFDHDTLPRGKRLQIYSLEHNDGSYAGNKTLQH